MTSYDDRVVTGEAVALDLRTAGIGSRGIAAVIDAVVQLAVGLGLVFAVGAAAGGDGALFAAVGLTCYVLVVLGYPVGLETLLHGRTLGKMVMGLRVVRDDGGPIRFRHAFVRGLVGVVAERPGALLFVPALVCMLVNRRSKRLGDIAAGTVVLQERVPGTVATPASFVPPQLAAWAATLDVTGVDADLAMRLRTFLSRASQLSPWARDDLGNRLAAEVAARVAPPPPGTPGWAYLAAVLGERRRRDEQRAAPGRQRGGPASQPPPPPAAAPPAPPVTPPPPTPPASDAASPFAPPV